ncbi:adenosylmethionine decarboxylase (plasmid) [Microbulbifer sp. MKSA007]|nr:adenosylmethionine decarboxylase [Microbulbifer sp. MKSA007]
MNDFSPSTHILLDFYGCKHLTDAKALKSCMLAAAKEAGATVLRCNLHEFGEDAGVTGVAILAESHISIHTWPEIDFAAIDIFMCGKADAEKAASVLQKLLEPSRIETTKVARGCLEA